MSCSHVAARLVKTFSRGSARVRVLVDPGQRGGAFVFFISCECGQIVLEGFVVDLDFPVAGFYRKGVRNFGYQPARLVRILLESVDLLCHLMQLLPVLSDGDAFRARPGGGEHPEHKEERGAGYPAVCHPIGGGGGWAAVTGGGEIAGAVCPAASIMSWRSKASLRTRWS